jgi:tripartite-type tricarboxylate transporter receptor subunit TctC
MRRALISATLAGIVLSFAAPATAQTYPTRPVKIVVPFGAGGITDLYARLLADRLQEPLGQPVIVENRPGQGGSFGPASVAKSEPDGYTLLTAGGGNAIGETLYKNLPYSILKDFTPVVRGVSAVNLLFVNPSVKATNVKELIALAKANPGKLTYASSGHGGIYHLAMELFKFMTGTNILHVPYRTETAARTDVITGQVDMMISAYGVVLPGMQANQLRAIAITSPTRFSVAPDIPTLAESGLPGYDGDAWMGLLAPAGTPQSVVARIHNEVNKIQRRQDVRDKLAHAGIATVEMDNQAFARHLAADVARWKKVIEFSGAKIEQ